MIYRQGVEELEDLRYWVEHSGDSSQNYDTLAAAKAEAVALIEEATSDETPTENPGDSEDPDTKDPVGSDGSAEPGSIGAFIEARKLMITAVSGCMGLGLVAAGSIKRDDDP